MIRFGQDVCGSLRNMGVALRRERVETNGIGGFASGELLTAAICVGITGSGSPRQNFLSAGSDLLSKVEQTLRVTGNVHILGTNRFLGVVHPQRFQFLSQHRLEPAILAGVEETSSKG